MKRHSISAFVSLVSIILLSSGCGKIAEKAGIYTELSKGSKAPDFTVECNDGSTVTLSDCKNKVILLNFWASWCSPCVEEMPALERLQETYGDKVEIIAVNCSEKKETVDNFAEEMGYTFLIGYDESEDVRSKYPSAGLPYTVIIGEEGLVEEVFTGAKDADSQYKLYRRALKGVFEN